MGGDVGFFKNDVELQANVPLLVEQCSVQASLNAGFLRTIDPHSKTVTIADKAFSYTADIRHIGFNFQQGVLFCLKI